jgi:hypothetical protein
MVNLHIFHVKILRLVIQINVKILLYYGIFTCYGCTVENVAYGIRYTVLLNLIGYGILKPIRAIGLNTAFWSTIRANGYSQCLLFLRRLLASLPMPRITLTPANANQNLTRNPKPKS